jgi:hypothetical protein
LTKTDRSSASSCTSFSVSWLSPALLSFSS